MAVRLLGDMVMKNAKRKSRLGLGLLVIGAAMAGGLPGTHAANPDPTSFVVAGPGVIDDPKMVKAAPESMLGDYLAGNFALDTGNIQDAASYFERALAEDPDNIELRRQVFLLDLADGRYDAAIAEARRLQSEDSGEVASEDGQLLLALELVKAGSFDSVPAALSRIGDQGITALASPFVEAWSRFGADGAAGLDAAIALLHAGESLGPLNDYHEAMLLDLGGRTERALAKLDGLLPETGPAPVRVVQTYADILVRLGRQDEARALVGDQLNLGSRPILQRVFDHLKAGQAPGLPFDDPGGGIADALLGIAEALQQERGSARAILYGRLALYLRPDLAEGYLLIGDILAGQENFDAAIAAYDSIDAESPNSYAAKVRKGQALHDLGQKEAAFSLLREVADLDPDQTDALIQLGNLLRRDELYERAEKAYSQAIARIDEPEPGQWTLYYARGITYERTKRWPEAEADFLFALELEPDQPFVLNYLGYSWVDQGLNLEEAQDMLHQAVAARPDDGFIVDSLGWVFYRLEDFERAVEQLERAVELQPGDPVINDHLGDAYWQVGREREAYFQWRRALTLDPEEDETVKIREKLKFGLKPDRS